MNAVITVVGKDTVGILAKVSGKCAEYNVNVLEVSQTVLREMFCMIMVCDISSINIEFNSFADIMSELGKSVNLSIHTMHQDIFDSMHRI